MTWKDLLPWNWGKCWKRWRAQREERQAQRSMIRVYDDLFDLSCSIDNLFSSFWNRAFGAELSLDGRGCNRLLTMPRVCVCENASGLEVTADVTGLKENQLDVDVQGRVLRIRGVHQEDVIRPQGRYCWNERSYREFRQDITLPDDIDRNKIQATYRRGVLKIEIPRRPRAHAQRIPIQAA
jgi:HSP20 family protein